MREDEDGGGAKFTLVSPLSRQLRNHSQASTPQHMENVFVGRFHPALLLSESSTTATWPRPKLFFFLVVVLFHYYVLKETAQLRARERMI